MDEYLDGAGEKVDIQRGDDDAVYWQKRAEGAQVPPSPLTINSLGTPEERIALP